METFPSNEPENTLEENVLEVTNDPVLRPEKEKRDERVAQMAEIAEKFRDRVEIFPFPGIASETVDRVRRAEKEYLKSEEYEMCGIATTSIDDLILMCEGQGVKVVPGPKGSGNFCILPAGSSDVFNDKIMPWQLGINDQMDDDLRTLILLSRENWNAANPEEEPLPLV